MTQNAPLIRARGIVIYGNKVLLMHRIKNGVEYYTLCGGKAEENETAEDACIREIFEETGLHVQLVKEVHRYNDRHEGIENIHIFFLCHSDGGEPKLNGEETERNTDTNVYNPLWIDLPLAATLPVKPDSILPVIQQIFRRFVTP